MDMTGEYRISAPRSRVWEALNDPEILKQCIPGCEEIQKQSDTEMTAKVTAKVGPVKAKFAGKVTLSDINPPNGYTITGEGSGGAAGFGKGGAKVNLADAGPDTVLTYTAHAQVGGKLAQIGSRLIDGTARKMADDFFAKFTEVVGRPADAPVAEPAVIEASRAEASPVVESPAASASPAVEDTLVQPAAALSSETAAVPPPAPARTEAPAPATAEQSRGLQPMIWIPLVIVMVGALLWVFT
ncbi:carbon monoxide dehydrogenase [Skermanella rosea]|uniref:SRPBCC family protein n=1 Tax=Skermanella rosea TaxID=1817965 RepID=UPI0019333E49|nr:carbon monoxide dehydrogenase subunit G [Skermanella rosea]UEM06391.1 carbon monoxide dehydrogenase [Skermanella rosea]